MQSIRASIWKSEKQVTMKVLPYNSDLILESMIKQRKSCSLKGIRGFLYPGPFMLCCWLAGYLSEECLLWGLTIFRTSCGTSISSLNIHNRSGVAWHRSTPVFFRFPFNISIDIIPGLTIPLGLNQLISRSLTLSCGEVISLEQHASQCSICWNCSRLEPI